MKYKKIRIFLFVLVIIILTVITIYTFPLFASLAKEEKRIEFHDYINSKGFLGVLIMLAIQILQVVVAFIPGEPIELLMGMMYGPFWGLVTCLTGIIIGTFIIYILAKKIGKPFLEIFIGEEKINNYKFLKDQKKQDALVFFLFFIPGTPKDALTYAAPFLNIPLKRFLIIATIARIPNILTSTITGENIGKGNWKITIIMFGIMAVLAIAGMIIHYLYMKKVENKDK